MKNILLDTHTFLWFLAGDEQLSEKAKLSIEDLDKTKYISIASIWEIALKLSLGKLNLDVSLNDLKNEIVNNGFEILPLDFEHIIELYKLENHHKDPFDRILIAQAVFEGYTLLSKDVNFKQYKKLKLSW